MRVGEKTAAHEAELVRVSPQEAVLRGLLHDRIWRTVRWLDARAPAYRARVGA